VRLERLTPRGPGGVALVGCSGSGAARAVAAVFVRSRGEGLPPVGRLALGRILDPQGDPVDEVLLSRIGPDAFEVGCHGGPAVVDRVRAALQAAGGGKPRPYGRVGEGFTPSRASGEEPCPREPDDRIQAEARAALPLATTELGCKVLLRQLAGALSREVADLEARLEADPNDLVAAAGTLRDLLDTARLGAALFAPPEVALVGAPNAGKSSLMNALLGKERVLVSPGAGTTRDAVADAAVLCGVPAVLVDTAGQRETEDGLEAAGVERAKLAAASAALRLVVLDASALTDAALDLCRATLAPKVVALNKIDLLDEAALRAARGRVEGCHSVSATCGEGLQVLRVALRDALVGKPRDSESALFMPRQVGLVEGALRALTGSDSARAARCLAALRG